MTANVFWMIGFYILGTISALLFQPREFKFKNKCTVLEKENKELKEIINNMSEGLQYKNNEIEKEARKLLLNALNYIIDMVQKEDNEVEETK